MNLIKWEGQVHFWAHLAGWELWTGSAGALRGPLSSFGGMYDMSCRRLNKGSTWSEITRGFIKLVSERSPRPHITRPHPQFIKFWPQVRQKANQSLHPASMSPCLFINCRGGGHSAANEWVQVQSPTVQFWTFYLEARREENEKSTLVLSVQLWFPLSRYFFCPFKSNCGPTSFVLQKSPI